MRKLKNQNGLLTVELAILTPVIIFIIFFIFHFGYALYYQTAVQGASHHVLQRIAAVWSNNDRDLETGALIVVGNSDRRDNIAFLDLYSDLFRTGSEDRLKAYKNYLNQKLVEIPFADANAKYQVDLKMKDFVVYKSLIMIVTYETPTPFSPLMYMFGNDGNVKFTFEQEAVIEDPAEMIRNVEYAKELINKIELINNFLKEASDFKDTIIQFIDDKL